MPPTAVPARVVRRFVKSGHVIEFHERTVTAFKAIEFIVFVDGEVRCSELFHGSRLPEYPSVLETRAKQLAENGWVEQPLSAHGL
jgi:hypothetical protein